MAKRIIVSEVTPLGDHVTLSRDRWREIIRYKHPALAGHENDIRDCLRDPDVIRSSMKDPDTHLCYRTAGNAYLCVVIGGEDNLRRFVITAYFTRGLKKGRELWTR
jgi:hypothetical protein